MKDSIWQLARKREERWVIEYGDYEANKEFHRARLKAMIRLLVGALRSRHETTRAQRGPNSTGNGLMVAIDEIVGRIDGKGRCVRRLPPLRRASAATWCHLFKKDVEEYPALTVRSGPGGWYLAGGAGSLLYLEIMRAKGWRRLRVVELTDELEKVVPATAAHNAECCCEADQLAS